MLHKIGAYIRVSSEEQAQVIEGSLDSQQHRLKVFIDLKNSQDGKWGKLVDAYIDDGYSAKDTKRPAYQRMLKDVRSGKINMILVTDISRLSRNIFDFCQLLKELETYKAKFFSAKEQFDTSSPAGEMMIYNMINLAQFERKQTSERVSMNFHSRAMRGLLNGGNPILGYDKDPTNPGILIINKEEACAVRKIFELYLEKGSLQKTAVALTATGIRPKVSPDRNYRHVAEGRWTVGAVKSHLTNYTYIGKREVNKTHKNEEQESLKSWHRYQIVKASWAGIVEPSIFKQVQKLVEENRASERARITGGEKRVYLLSGILRCGECGLALIGQTAHGRSEAHRYYGHKKIVGETIKCKVKSFRADEIETAVTDHLGEILLRAGHLDKVEANIKKMLGAHGADYSVERIRVQKDLTALEKDIDSAFKLYSEMSSNKNVLSVIQEKLEKLSERKRTLNAYFEEVNSKISVNNDAKMAKSVIEERAQEFKKGWRKSGTIKQKRLLRRLVDKLVYTSEGLYTYYVIDQFDAPVLAKKESKLAPGVSSGAIFKKNFVIGAKNKKTTVAHSYGGSSVVWGGGGKAIVLEPLLAIQQWPQSWSRDKGF